ncbi:MAG: hypothetical protein C4322_07115 [Mastigocladus sp. ERB_26_1]
MQLPIETYYTEQFGEQFKRKPVSRQLTPEAVDADAHERDRLLTYSQSNDFSLPDRTRLEF